ncbi:hypothetical protein KY284_013195 [Solanum tuberosum]|nr:hypothetical protein KY284_013195 [Solanum tuberosum]
MDEIYNYEDSSAQATDEVESSEENSDNGDEETNRDSQDTGDEDDDPLSLPTCAREIFEFALITGLNCSAYPRDAKLKKVLQKGTRLNMEKKLKYSLVWFVHSMLFAHDQSKIVDSNHIKMVDDLDFFKSYPWGKEFEYMRLFLILVNYAKKSLDSPLPISRLHRWHTAKSDNIIEGDPFKYKGCASIHHTYCL